MPEFLTDFSFYHLFYLSILAIMVVNAWLLWENRYNPVPREWRWLAEVGSGDTIVEIDGVYYSVTEIQYEE